MWGIRWPAKPEGEIRSFGSLAAMRAYFREKYDTSDVHEQRDETRDELRLIVRRDGETLLDSLIVHLQSKGKYMVQDRP